MKVSVTSIFLALVFFFAFSAGPKAGEAEEAAVVKIVGTVNATRQHPEFHGNGTGFHIGHGYFITNEHVTNKADSIVIKNDDKMEPVPVEIVWADHQKDISILHVKGFEDSPLKDMPALKLSKEVPKVGDEVEAIGYPGGDGPFHTYGRVASKVEHPDNSPIKRANKKGKQDGDDQGIEHDIFATNMSTIAGMSGGPILNKKGEVVAVNEATFPVIFGPGMFVRGAPMVPPQGPFGVVIPNYVYLDKLNGLTASQ